MMANQVARASDVLSKGQNSFGVLRLLLAAAVIVSHSWSIGGYGFEPLTLETAGISLGLFAVTGFFSLSGLLVGVSAEKSTTGSFLRRRSARILPGYWGALLVSGVIFGVAISMIRGLDLHNALLSPANGSVRTYVVNNFPLSASQYNLGRVLDGMPYAGAINGSLWSLPYEFACYLIILVVTKWTLGAKNPTQLFAMLFVMSIALAVLANKQGPIFVGVGIPILGTLDSRLFFNLWLAFMAGAFVAHLRHRICITGPLTVLSCVLVTFSLVLNIFWPWGVLVLPFAIVGLGHHLPAQLRRIGDATDISYGLYLYGFPVSQLIIAVFGQDSLNAPLLAVASVVGTIPLAYLSWHLVEKRFLATH
jgi:peptidoglycan/LPS O-acetylase OafA/YrhL